MLYVEWVFKRCKYFFARKFIIKQNIFILKQFIQHLAFNIQHNTKYELF